MTRRKAKKAKIGRPQFEPTLAMRKRVSIGAAAGMTEDELAAALGISAPTLRKHFAAELGSERALRRLDMLEAMYVSGERGNVSAQKAYVAYCDKAQGAVIPLHPAFVGQSQPKPEKKGKKQQQQEDATTAQVGTEWNDLLTPARPQ